MPTVITVLVWIFMGLIGFVGLVFLPIFSYRNSMTFKFRMRAGKIISERIQYHCSRIHGDARLALQEISDRHAVLFEAVEYSEEFRAKADEALQELKDLNNILTQKYYIPAKRWRGVYYWFNTQHTYQNLLWNLRIWKFEQAFPDLEQVIDSMFLLKNHRRSEICSSSKNVNCQDTLQEPERT